MATSEIAAPMLSPSDLGHSEEFHSNMHVGLVFAVDPDSPSSPRGIATRCGVKVRDKRFRLNVAIGEAGGSLMLLVSHHWAFRYPRHRRMQQGKA
jgi:hypothetical protein